MASLDDLLNSVTDEDGIRGDFIEGVRLAYDEDMSLKNTEIEGRDSQIAELIAERDGLTKQIEDMSASHLAELNAVKAAEYDKIMYSDGGSDSEVDAVDATPSADDTVNDYSSDLRSVGLWEEE